LYHNPLFAIDFYKVDHRRQYPPGTTEIYSNLTPRYFKPNHSFGADYDEKVVVFGIQAFIQDYLDTQWNTLFFYQEKHAVIEEYKTLIQKALGVSDFDTSHLKALHDLGYLPIRIKAIGEGFRVPIGVPVLTIVNTHPDFFWLTNYLETIISASLWKPMTSATIAFEFKKLLTHYATLTGSDPSFVDFQAHDFSFRGMSGWDDASLSGAAHLTCFKGTDCVSAIDYLDHYYDADRTVDITGMSVPATEHSVMCATGTYGELDTIRRLITQVYPEGIVSIVADSYDLWRTLDVYLPALYDSIIQRQGKVVIRPDSGNPVDIIMGDLSALPNSPAYKGALQLLWENFGGRVNAAGFKELNSKVGLIYGDAITLNRANLMLQLMHERGFASSNIVFGVGSYTYQYVTRDTLGFAIKATSAVIEGKRHAIYKDPITATKGNPKKSARGLLKVDLDVETGNFYLMSNVFQGDEESGHLQIVFEDGKLFNRTDLAEIRHNLEIELEHYS
jgi:nicotinamide phosphoribosyltransferase